MFENWDQHKDLEYYPDRVCRCGCGGRIKVRPHHKYRDGLPKYITGHALRNRKQTNRQKRKQSESQKGEKNSNWRGGKLKYRCKWCGALFQAYPSENREFCWDRKCVDAYKRAQGIHVRGPKKLPREIRVCACGCGGTFEVAITSKKRYINGHYFRGRKRSLENVENNRVAVTIAMNRPEVKVKLRTSHVGKCLSEEVIEKMKASAEKNWEDPEYREKQIVALNRPEVKAKHRVALKEANSHPETIARHQTAAKERWKDPEYKEKQLKAIFKGIRLLPNKPEKFLDKLFQKLFPNQWKYTGDGSFWITSSGKHLNPDFVHVNQKKIIEHFGDWWHGEEVTGIPNEQHERERIDLFAQHGYQTLIIWEHELENTIQLQSKLEEFCASV